MRDEQDKKRRPDEEPGPAEESEGGTIGSVDERSSENRQDGLRKDRERARDEGDVGGEDPD